MTTFIALLRGINSGQNPSQKMENLRKIFEDLGFDNVKSVIASGNIIFDSESKSKKDLENKIEQAIKRSTGVDTATIIIAKRDLQKLIDRNPFKGIKDNPKNRFNVTFTKNKPEKLLQISKKGKGYKILDHTNNAVFFVIDLTQAKTPDLMKLLEQNLGKNITTRTWQTVLKIIAKASQ